MANPYNTIRVSVGNTDYFVGCRDLDFWAEMAKKGGVKYAKVISCQLSRNQSFIKIWGITELCKHLKDKQNQSPDQNQQP